MLDNSKTLVEHTGRDVKAIAPSSDSRSVTISGFEKDSYQTSTDHRCHASASPVRFANVSTFKSAMKSKNQSRSVGRGGKLISRYSSLIISRFKSKSSADIERGAGRTMRLGARILSA